MNHLHLQLVWCRIFDGDLQQRVVDGVSHEVGEVQQLDTHEMQRLCRQQTAVVSWHRDQMRASSH